MGFDKGPDKGESKNLEKQLSDLLKDTGKLNSMTFSEYTIDKDSAESIGGGNVKTGLQTILAPSLESTTFLSAAEGLKVGSPLDQLLAKNMGFLFDSKLKDSPGVLNSMAKGINKEGGSLTLNCSIKDGVMFIVIPGIEGNNTLEFPINKESADAQYKKEKEAIIEEAKTSEKEEAEKAAAPLKEIQDTKSFFEIMDYIRYELWDETQKAEQSYDKINIKEPKKNEKDGTIVVDFTGGYTPPLTLTFIPKTGNIPTNTIEFNNDATEHVSKQIGNCPATKEDIKTYIRARHTEMVAWVKNIGKTSETYQILAKNEEKTLPADLEKIEEKESEVGEKLNLERTITNYPEIAATLKTLGVDEKDVEKTVRALLEEADGKMSLDDILEITKVTNKLKFTETLGFSKIDSADELKDYYMKLMSKPEPLTKAQCQEEMDKIKDLTFTSNHLLDLFGNAHFQEDLGHAELAQKEEQSSQFKNGKTNIEGHAEVPGIKDSANNPIYISTGGNITDFNGNKLSDIDPIGYKNISEDKVNNPEKYETAKHEAKDNKSKIDKLEGIKSDFESTLNSQLQSIDALKGFKPEINIQGTRMEVTFGEKNGVEFSDKPLKFFVSTNESGNFSFSYIPYGWITEKGPTKSLNN
ncbi:MAG: hypothetical protein WC269_02225, partial [Candidatus Gracilibacteria bacterium]